MKKHFPQFEMKLDLISFSVIKALLNKNMRPKAIAIHLTTHPFDQTMFNVWSQKVPD